MQMSTSLQEVKATDANEAMHLQTLAHYALRTIGAYGQEAIRVAKILYANGWRAEDVI